MKLFKSDFDKIYEKLTTLNEGTDYYASKSFWDAAKNKIIDVESFHDAYDDELKELGLMDIFTSEGTLINKGVYGKIKTAKEANPDSWAIKALMKMWSLKYIDNAITKSETPEEQERLAREKERKQEEQRLAELSKEYTALIPEAIKKIDPELVKRFFDYWKVGRSSIRVPKEVTVDNLQLTLSVSTRQPSPSWTLVLSSQGYYLLRKSLVINDLENHDKLEDVISVLTQEFKAADEEYSREEAEKAEEERKKLEQERKEAEKKQRYKDEKQNEYKTKGIIDVLDYAKYRWSFYGEALLLGESGKIYHLREKGGMQDKSLTKYLNREVITVKSLKDISEPYKVIYTCVHEDEGSHWGGNNSYTYYSWDSSEQDLLKPILPEVGFDNDIATSRSTYSSNSGNGRTLSILDNIDTWYITTTTHWSLD